MLPILVAEGVARAFCGTFVGAPGAELVNHTSQVVIARQGEHTTLTLVADFAGDTSEFALLIPVPEALGPEDVRVIDPTVVDRLDRYSTPRLVRYTCRDAVTVDHLGTIGPGCMLGGCSDSSSTATMPIDVDFDSAEGGVTVEAAFRAAEYDVVVLSATGAGGLYDWLDDNGFAVPPGGDDVLQDYIDGGAHFLAAKVWLDDGATDAPSRLSPLQLSYDAASWSLPIRIGTISAEGEQEIVVYTLTSDAMGDVEITNYREGRVRDECMLPVGKDEFATFYGDAVREARVDDGPTWVTEYSWVLYRQYQDTGYHCDPCTVEEEELYDAGELADLGYVDDGYASYGTYSYGYGYGGGGPLLTRIRMVYSPDEVPEDLVLVQSGVHEQNRQIRYVQRDRRLEFLFPVCGEGFVEDPGMCGDELDEESKGRGRAAFPPALAVALGALGLALAGRRR